MLHLHHSIRRSPHKELLSGLYEPPKVISSHCDQEFKIRRGTQMHQEPMAGVEKQIVQGLHLSKHLLLVSL